MTERYINAYDLAETIENLDITVAGKPARWNDAKYTVLKEIAEAPDADVAPRAEVERLEQILNSYALQYGTVKDQQEVIDKIKRETAREIFAEIRKIVTAIYNKHIFGSDLEDEEKEAVMDFEVDISSAFDELEEEYGITDNAPKE